MDRWCVDLIEVEVLFSSSAIGTQVLLKGRGEDILVDAGDGVLRDLVAKRYDFSRLLCVLITHEHIDHFSGLLPLCYFMAQLGHCKQLRILTPSGGGKVSQLLLLSDSLPQIKVEKAVPNLSCRVGAFAIEPFKVEHTVEEAVGYTVSDTSGYKVVVSGDTRKCAELEARLHDVNVAVLDATFPEGMEYDAYLHGHLTEAQASQLAKAAKETRLIHKIDLGYYRKMSCRRHLQT